MSSGSRRSSVERSELANVVNSLTAVEGTTRRLQKCLPKCPLVPVPVRARAPVVFGFRQQEPARARVRVPVGGGGCCCLSGFSGVFGSCLSPGRAWIPTDVSPRRRVVRRTFVTRDPTRIFELRLNTALRGRSYMQDVSAQTQETKCSRTILAGPASFDLNGSNYHWCIIHPELSDRITIILQLKAVV